MTQFARGACVSYRHSVTVEDGGGGPIPEVRGERQTPGVHGVAGFINCTGRHLSYSAFTSYTGNIIC